MSKILKRLEKLVPTRSAPKASAKATSEEGPANKAISTRKIIGIIAFFSFTICGSYYIYLKNSQKPAPVVVVPAPPTEQEENTRALVALKAQDYAVAESILGALSGKNQNSIELKVNLAAVHKRQGKFTEAQKQLSEVLDIDGENFIALNNLALVESELGNNAKAEKLMLKAIELKPGFVEGHLNLAIFYEKTKAYDQAVKYYQEYLQLKGLDKSLANSIRQRIPRLNSLAQFELRRKGS